MEDRGKRTQAQVSCLTFSVATGSEENLQGKKEGYRFCGRNFIKLSPDSFCFLCESEKGTRRVRDLEKKEKF